MQITKTQLQAVIKSVVTYTGGKSELVDAAVLLAEATLAIPLDNELENKSNPSEPHSVQVPYTTEKEQPAKLYQMNTVGWWLQQINSKSLSRIAMHGISDSMLHAPVISFAHAKAVSNKYAAILAGRKTDFWKAVDEVGFKPAMPAEPKNSNPVTINEDGYVEPAVFGQLHTKPFASIADMHNDVIAEDLRQRFHKETGGVRDKSFTEMCNELAENMRRYNSVLLNRPLTEEEKQRIKGWMDAKPTLPDFMTLQEGVLSTDKPNARKNCPDTVVHIDEDGLRYEYSLGESLHLLLKHLATYCPWETVPQGSKEGFIAWLHAHNLLK